MSDPLQFSERIRIKCNLATNNANAVDVITNQAPVTYRGAGVRWELGFFVDANTIVSDWTDFVSFTFRVVDKATRLVTIFEETVLKVDLDNAALTKTEWDTGTYDKANHVVFMSSAETNIAVSAVNDFKQSYTVIIIANWTDPDGNATKDVLAKIDWTIEEANIQAVLPAIGGTSENFLIRGDGKICIYNPGKTVAYPVWIDDSDGTPKLVIENP